ncbi:tRNA pseudouridine(55) synthase TruB [Paenibacillus bovis]|uniref:tRNA pseudouridine synthase B n=1 Tax=Paenibacillus bovis TaxID=1616788 RepID=A0A172ZGZ8_9BACL|nr:tRNA pseudouridine(55) synthase TruB [Paenibacillus bovis]ANF96567.1 tRNA pseudouridine(55) synthase TruB [Paenibacillus bovis]
MNQFDGVLAVHKPAGFTSHDVVAKVRRLVSMKRIGHTGTLDPAVTGVLPLCLGRSTRIVEYLQEMPKEYEATLRFGIATDTEDLTGEITEQVDEVQLTEQQVHEALQSMIGTISQVPPMYSAVKVDGKRLYELAREGKTVERKAREVTIYSLEMTGWKPGAHPEVSFRVLCSKGTYIRTLCVDVGRALHVPSTMVQLVRTQSAGIQLDQCLTFEQIEELVQSGELEQHLIPADQAMSGLPSFAVDHGVYKSTLQGKKIDKQYIHPVEDSSVSGTSLSEELQQNHMGLFKLYGPEQIFIGIFREDEQTGQIVPVKVFLPA